MLLSSKNLRTALASLLLVAGLTVAAPAMADETVSPLHHTDVYFHFDLGVEGAGATAATAGESKEETSPLMIYPTWITFDQCRVYGEGSFSPTDFSANNGSYLTIGGYGIVFGWDAERRLILRTNIKENYFTYARLTAWQSSQPGEIEGVWSPDCYEQSTDIVINAGYR